MGGNEVKGVTRPHDLLRLIDGEIATLTQGAPPWVKSALDETPFVVVRRDQADPGMVAVGVRGAARSERYGSVLGLRDGRVVITPESLADAGGWRLAPYRGRVPALDALETAAHWLGAAGWRWGPCGSVGFELATGRATATDASDLDIVVQAPTRLEKRQLAEVASVLSGCDCRIDVMLETPLGGIALRELAFATDAILARTSSGPKFVTDPWQTAFPAQART